MILKPHRLVDHPRRARRSPSASFQTRRSQNPARISEPPPTQRHVQVEMRRGSSNTRPGPALRVLRRSRSSGRRDACRSGYRPSATTSRRQRSFPPRRPGRRILSTRKGEDNIAAGRNEGAPAALLAPPPAEQDAAQDADGRADQPDRVHIARPDIDQTIADDPDDAPQYQVGTADRIAIGRPAAGFRCCYLVQGLGCLVGRGRSCLLCSKGAL